MTLLSLEYCFTDNLVVSSQMKVNEDDTYTRHAWEETPYAR